VDIHPRRAVKPEILISDIAGEAAALAELLETLDFSSLIPARSLDQG